MRIGFVSTYLPIECGIATYTSYLNEALRKIGNETFAYQSVVRIPYGRAKCVYWEEEK